MRKDRTQGDDAISPEAGSVRPEKKVFLLMLLCLLFPIYTSILDVYRQAHASRGPETLSSTAFRRSPDCASLLVVELNSTLASRTVSGCYTAIFEPPLHQLQCLVIGMPAKKPTCLLRRHRDGSLAYSRGIMIAYIFQTPS